MYKYAICYISYSIGEATKNSQIIWLTDTPLGWVTELEKAKIWDDRVSAEAFMNDVKQSTHQEQILNLVTINWYEQ
ncbi:MAG: hypothetical protein EAZ73_09010 [Oscillatoriales cyanobacterium]|uniref:hypothetical protein n=1 Tax=unclassified Microcoleus TaxID=2642155 RepID=UPI001D9DE101|nr:MULTISPECIES: hypothetical protein [unclassified Microcoleus]TAF00883.1 MAG: hypothetical protein EAZ79_01590 [Oscillatoriales cyanobacterium]MCC3459776.1 hypothetical protein [Microcoleus sp. PH2017_11_PCY_U_A]MCC3478209.1 hypothetical protein [Microcoleus sp. PH2017_12_PCY_D_A]TAF21359.1 MAG: hypothetical protein EAZ73_09010 [Oscillatoriales cyanobacterium]TAF39714.1 MAG: hypothetical protein EAZ69_00335 [Oscillatoriales cyanobacterium]